MNGVKPVPIADWNEDQLRGAIGTLRLLDTSPRFNRPQRQVIEELHERALNAMCVRRGHPLTGSTCRCGENHL